MDIETRLELIKRPPTEEITTEEELRRLLETKEHPVTYCGYETSGPIHIGHFLSILKQIHLQKAGFKVKVLWPDLHTFLNRKGSMDWIHKMQEYSKHCFVACGLDPKKTIFVQGSDFQLRKDYMEDVLRFSLLTTITRAKRSMTIIGRHMENARVSQVIYPIMQAVDIVYLDVDVAHGGMEQRKIHMIAREFLPKLNHKKPICLHSSILMALTGPGDKMSSSKPETMIALHDSPEIVEERIKGAFCPEKRLKNNPIIEICRLIVFPCLKKLEVRRPKKYGGDVVFYTFNELVQSYRKGNLHPLDLKNAVSTALIQIFQPVRDYFKKRPEILDILKLPRNFRQS